MVKLRGREKHPIYFGASVQLLKIAKELRQNMTPAEIVLWNKLRKKQVNNHIFRRQHPIFKFVVDFFCYEIMLAIEVDGDVHEDSYQGERDIERTRILNRLGIEVLRFKNHEVFYETESVLKKIKNYLEK